MNTLNLINKYKSLIEKSYENAEKNISKINNDGMNIDGMNIDGMTGIKIHHFCNNILNTDDSRYLEICCWKPSSVYWAMYNNNAKILCIENYNKSADAKNEFLNNLNKFKGNNEVIFIESNCFELDISKLSKFNIYMYVGIRTELAHYNALFYYYNCLDDIFIYIVDNWYWQKVRDGTNKVIKDLNLKILYEKNIIKSNYIATPDKWMYGIYIVLLQK
jgi:hypothetical protein